MDFIISNPLLIISIIKILYLVAAILFAPLRGPLKVIWFFVKVILTILLTLFIPIAMFLSEIFGFLNKGFKQLDLDFVKKIWKSKSK